MSNKFIHYLLHRPTWQKLPILPRMYSTDYDVSEVDQDTEMLMRLTQTRCPQGVEILKRRYKVNDAHVLAQTLEPRFRARRILNRLIRLYRSFMGLTAYDPMKSQRRKYLQQDRYGE